MGACNSTTYVNSSSKTDTGTVFTSKTFNLFFNLKDQNKPGFISLKNDMRCVTARSLYIYHFVITIIILLLYSVIITNQ